MKKGITRVLLIALLGGAVALWGCEKMAPAELSPVAVRTTQDMAAPNTNAAATPAQDAWLRFVDRVERGEVVDPAGQYVAKGTRTKAVEAMSKRVSRPKYDAATRAFRQHYFMDRRGEVTSTGQDPLPSIMCPNTDDCYGSGGPVIVSTFVSSEGIAPYSGADNPNGYIYDLKVGRGYAQGDHDGIPGSYTVLYSDLNKGAGGPFMYIGFTRVPNDVSQNPEIIYNEPYNFGPVTLLGISKKYNFNDDYSFFASNSFPIWADTGIRLGFNEYDLNQDVGGTYIHAMLSKAPDFGNPIEIGVLSSNSSTTQPPAGWTKASIDLNEGAGGDYIYFCIKRY